MNERFEYDEGDRIAGKRGEYRVKQQLGAGGMGACYLVEDTDAPREYVLKTMLSRLAQKDRAREAFELEARGLIALHACPNIVQAYHLDYTSQRVPFYLMEVLSGLSLRQILQRRGKLRPEIAMGIAVDIANALVFAHDKQVVHCDLKPDNVFVIHRPEGPLAKLLDFGVMKARLVGAGYGGIAGTPSYMAPEQIRGQQDVDARADMFAFGVTFYEMLAGRHPFLDYGLNEEGAIARLDQLPKPLNQAARDIPWQLVNIFDDLIAHLLEPNAANRYKDASLIHVKLHEAERVIGRLTKGSVHDASTNPIGPGRELIAQTTGVVDEEAIAPKTDPKIDLSSDPQLAEAIARSAKRPPRQAASASAASGVATKMLELTSAEREFVNNLDKHVAGADGRMVLKDKPRPRAAATFVEGDDYHQRMKRKGRLSTVGALRRFLRRNADALMIGIAAVAIVAALAYLMVFLFRSPTHAPSPQTSPPARPAAS